MKDVQWFCFIIFLLFSVSSYAQNSVKNEAEIYSFSETHPSFPGGVDSLKNFVKRNLQYPGGGKLCCDGAVYVSFVVNENGRLSDFKIDIGACGQLFNNSAIDVFKKMPKWNPGKQNDRAVKVRCVYPVRFS